MTTTEDKPVDREAWRRLLDADGEGPPELTDARIRAQARRALTPRTASWWLPASLAASLLLAVLLVQWQYERPSAPVLVSESDYAAAPAEAPALDDESQLNAAPQPQQEEAAPASALPRRDNYEVNTPTTAVTQQRVAEAEAERDQGFVAPPPPVVPPPQIDLPATADSRVPSGVIASAPAAEAPTTDSSADPAPAAEAKREKNLGEIVVTGSRHRQENVEATTPVTQVTSAEVSGQGMHSGALMKSDKAERTPEEWYAEIEKLRAAGKKREAKRELKKLEEAHPGWLEKNHPAERRE